jgi:CheY-like chemotaxis protein
VKTILVVDDESDMRDALQAILEAESYRVVTASNGRQALDLLEKGAATDLVLLDVMMPLMTGYQLLDCMQEKPELRKLAVVMMSAVDPPTRISDRWLSFLMKPFSYDDLLKAVRAAIP